MNKDLIIHSKDYHYCGFLKNDIDDICKELNIDIENSMLKIHMIIEPFEFADHKEKYNADI